MSQLPCMRPDSPRQNADPVRTAMDLAWAEVNALDGWHADDDLEAVGYSRAIRDALSIIHRLGGRDGLALLAADPVITWPRPIWYEPAKGRPPGLRAEDVLPCDVEKGDAS